MTTETKRTLGRTLLVALATAGVAQACGKDTAPVDAPTINGGNGGNSGSGGKGGKGITGGTDNPGGEGSGGSSGGSGGSSGKGGTGGKGGTAGTGNDGGTGNEGGEGSGDCVQNPTAPEDFLVRCTRSRCAPFDNFARIPGFDGTLPDL